MTARRRLKARDRLIVALDEGRLSAALALARRLRGTAGWVKIGSILFTAHGPEAVQRVRALGFRVMLDLKFHDIPSTVEASARSAARLRASLMTVHASGGAPMLEAAVRGARQEARRLRIAPPKILAVTVLTSVGGGRSRDVLGLARTALNAGCDGVVASAREAKALRAAFGPKPLIVCPGVRPAWAASNDQQRIATPAEAIASGASALVVGRPITAAADPRQAAARILGEMEDGG